jgi:hypothetical protein
MIIEWRRRDEKIKQQKRHHTHHKRRALVHQHKPFHQPTLTSSPSHSSSTSETFSLPFNKTNFEQAIVKLSEGIVQFLDQNTAITTEILLSVPDGNISEWYGRKILKEQLDVRLTQQEMRCLCMKLRGEQSSSSSLSPSSSVSSAAPLLTHNPSFLSRSPSFSPSCQPLPSLSPISISSSSSTSSSSHSVIKQKKYFSQRSFSSSSERQAGEVNEEGNSLPSGHPLIANSGGSNNSSRGDTNEDPMVSGKALKTLVINLRNMIVKKRHGHIPLLPIVTPTP